MYDTKDSNVLLRSVKKGREHLGREIPIEIYRLLENTIWFVLSERYGTEECAEIMKDAGRMAGSRFAKYELDISLGFNEFIADLQQKMKEKKIGILRIEDVTEEQKICITLTISEDVDCSGSENIGEAICNYDEGFMEGIFSEYVKRPFSVRKVDRWAKGEWVSRFVAREIA